MEHREGDIGVKRGIVVVDINVFSSLLKVYTA